jgi:acyl dehydratase
MSTGPTETSDETEPDRSRAPVRITEEAIAAVRARIGEEFTVKRPPNLEEATKDAIRHWADALGDRDPKWSNAEYAATTRFGELVAPPSMVYAFDPRAIGDRAGMPGVHSFFAGADHEFYLPIKRNDAISLRVVLKDLVEKEGRFGGRMFQQISECTYTNQHGDIVARTWPFGMRVERTAGKSRDKYGKLELAQWTPEQIEAIADQYEDERSHIRGADTRFWDDVQIGDRLGPVIRGPWTPTTSIGYLKAAGGMFMFSHSEWYEYLRRHPKAGIPNGHGVPEGPARVHWDTEYAQGVGVPGAFDFGPERIGWLTTLCTYWCGDDGWLAKLDVKVNRFNVVGDLTTLEGVVTNKGGDGDEAFVEAKLWARDQRGIDTATGKARISLPQRGPTA